MIRETFEYPYRKSELNGKFSLRCFGPEVWNEMLPSELKNIENIDDFKVKIKKMQMQIVEVLHKWSRLYKLICYCCNV